VTGHAFEEITFGSGDSFCRGSLVRPRSDEDPAPLVILGHGLGATREMRLDAYAERFAEAGIAALTFTYRHFGDSGGEPRQLLSISRQLDDWEAALEFGRTLPGIDRKRMAVWGSSFGGGHAITVASRHPELAAAVAQCPFTDGLASSAAYGPVSSIKTLPRLAADLGSMVTGRPPVTIPVAGSPGEVALMNAPDALGGYLGLVPEQSSFVNSAAARIIPRLIAYRPGMKAAKVRIPIMFCVSLTDSVAPARPTLRHARRAPRGEIKTYDAGHFEFYVGDAFEEISTDQTEFLVRHLKPEARIPRTVETRI